MRLADRIVVRIGGEDIELRPTLACAIRLERREGSLARLARDVLDGSLEAACDIIRDHSGDAKYLAVQVFDAGLDKLADPLMSYLMGCAGIDPEAPHQPAAALTDSVPMSDHLQSLYRIGTGWLGWSPEITLDATPLEILEAYKGRLDMLRAIYGAPEPQPKSAPVNLADKFRTVFGAFGTTKVLSKRRQHAGD